MAIVRSIVRLAAISAAAAAHLDDVAGAEEAAVLDSQTCLVQSSAFLTGTVAGGEEKRQPEGNTSVEVGAAAAAAVALAESSASPSAAAAEARLAGEVDGKSIYWARSLHHWSAASAEARAPVEDPSGGTAGASARGRGALLMDEKSLSEARGPSVWALLGSRYKPSGSDAQEGTTETRSGSIASGYPTGTARANAIGDFFKGHVVPLTAGAVVFALLGAVFPIVAKQL